jgi:hypothetical protein
MRGWLRQALLHPRRPGRNDDARQLRGTVIPERRSRKLFVTFRAGSRGITVYFSSMTTVR